MLKYDKHAGANESIDSFSSFSSSFIDTFNSLTSWTNFNQAEFVTDYFDKDWSNILNLKHGNANVSMENFVNKMNDLLDKPPPLKKISKFKLKFKTKPWITAALQKSISIKNLKNKWKGIRNLITIKHLHQIYIC